MSYDVMSTLLSRQREIMRCHGKRILYRSDNYLQMYRVHGTVIYMSMSADASCRGLVSPRDGPTTLELTQG